MLNPRLLEPQAECQDKMIWKPTTDGVFSLSSAYNLVRSKNNISLSDKKIWHTSLPQKISFFMANLWRSRISIDTNLYKFQIAGPSICDCCFAESETLDHLFAIGPRADHIWNFLEVSLGFFDVPKLLKAKCLYWWSCKSNNPMTQLLYQITPSIVCWFLWKARNGWRFEFSNTPSYLIISYVVWTICASLQVHFSKFKVQFSNWHCLLDKISTAKWRITSFPVLWKEHSLSFILNTDSSSLNHGNSAAGGGILRDSYRNMIFACSIFLGTASNIVAEYLSLHVGLLICDKKVHQVEVRSDPNILIDFVNGLAMVPRRLQPFFRKLSRYKHLAK